MKGWKTIIVGAIIAALGTIDATALVDIIPANYAGVIVGGIGIVMMWLRSITSTALGTSK